MTTVIRVNDTWYIDVDTDNYSVGKIKNIRTTTDKNGKAREEKKFEGYFTSLESALVYIRDRMVADALSAGDMDLADAAAKVGAINREFVDEFRRATGNKHGRWVKQSDRTKPLYGWNICSECGAVLGSVSPYCADCGAKMDGGET